MLDSLMLSSLILFSSSFFNLFSSSLRNLVSIDFLNKLGLDCYKIPSGEINNLPYLRKIGGLRKTVFMSTGMANLEEVRAATDILKDYGTPKEKIIVLHCNTDYPTTRGLEIEVTESEGGCDADIIWEYALPSEYFGFASGNVQKLDNNNCPYNYCSYYYFDSI